MNRNFGILAALVILTPSLAQANLVITPTFDSSVTAVPQLQSDITTAIGIYQSLYTNNINVSILFRYSTTAPDGSSLPTSTLAQSESTIYSQTYSTFVTLLRNESFSANDPYRPQALQNLPTANQFPNNPTTGSLNVEFSSANGRAVGLSTALGALDSSGGLTGSFDGIVTINKGVTNFQLSRAGGIAAGNFDVMQTIEHEMDEVLGFGSVLTTSFTNSNTNIRPQDLYRYSAANSISLTPSGTASSYFSIDGGNTSIVPFNQNPNQPSTVGDYGDWGSTSTPYVQLAFASPGTQSDVAWNSPEGIGLDAIGYNLSSSAIPEPSSLILFGLGAGALGLRAWRRRKAEA